MIENRKTTSYVSPLFLRTKLDEALILYKRKSGGSSSLVRRKNEGKANYQRYVNYMKNCNY